MTDEEVLNKYDEMIKFYDSKNIPDPVHEPIRFAYYIKMFKYYTKVVEETTSL